MSQWFTSHNCKCFCGFERESDQLYFCLKCNELRCDLCVSETIDIIFCPYCKADFRVDEADRCQNRCSCLCCPLDGSSLIIQTGENFLDFLQCKRCKWNSRSAKISDQKPLDEWPQHINPLLETFENIKHAIDGISLKPTPALESKLQRRLTFNKYGLSDAYNMRRQSLFPEANKSFVRKLDKIEATSPPCLDVAIFTKQIEIAAMPTLSQCLQQPLCLNTRKILPLRARLVSRNLIKCAECESVLYKGNKDPSNDKPQVERFARDYHKFQRHHG